MKGKQGKPGRVHRALKLQHHRHTAKRLPHHHTSYRALFVVLAVTALSMGTIQRSTAADLDVQATVPSASFTQPAEITSPLNGDTVTAQLVTVSGTCQVVVNSTIVVIERGGIVVASTPCQSNGTFSVQLTLQVGANPLLPKEYDSLNQQGPDGTEVTVFYVPPSNGGGNNGGGNNGGGTQVPTPSGGSGTPVAQPPIVAAPASAYWVSSVGGAFELVANILGGGGAPYTVDIDWGDGSPHQKVVLQKPGDLVAQHTYEKPGMYVIVLTITDVLGANVVLKTVAVILTAPAPTVAGPTGGSGIGNLLATPEAKAIWGAYLALMLATLSLWLTNPYHMFGRRTPVLVKAVKSHRRVRR